MKNYEYIAFVIEGNGTSLWGPSKGTWFVNKILYNGIGPTPYEIQVFGPTTDWYQYTDELIEKEVNEKLLKIVQKRYPNHKIKHISWSEQGMQPDKGWSFDVILHTDG